MRLIHLVRHGRTASNRQKRVMGWLDESIEPTSQADAEAVARALVDEDVGSIVSSPLRRALATAAPLAALVGLEPRIDDRFGEMHVGPWEGLSGDEVAAQWPTEWQEWQTEPHRLQLRGRETLADLNVRVAEALEQLSSESIVTGAAVVFTHDAVVRAAVAWALGTGPEIYRHVEVANCSITTVRIVDGLPHLLRTNDIGHLDGARGQG
ncbi:MAG: histidine phosphatase family protein [Actinomycetota bacterium]|nr:histidine phosphatase family protein [Actinomycetota bacterium]